MNMLLLGSGGVLAGVIAKPPIPALALLFSTGAPLQFSDGQYLELAA